MRIRYANLLQLDAEAEKGAIFARIAAAGLDLYDGEPLPRLLTDFQSA
jgi:hypothetical protein